jgi:hypothetical protein
MSISRIEGRLGQLADQPLETQEATQSPAQLAAEYITATRALQSLCAYNEEDQSLMIARSGNNVRISSAPAHIKNYETSEVVTQPDGRKVKQPLTVELYATATRTYSGSPQLATAKDPKGLKLKQGEERYFTDYKKPWKNSEYLSVTVFSKLDEKTCTKVREDIMRCFVPKIKMRLIKEDPRVGPYVEKWLIARKPDSREADDVFLSRVQEEGLDSASYDSLVMDLEEHAPAEVTEAYKNLESNMKDIVVRKSEQEFKRRTVTYYKDSTITWTAVPPKILTPERVKEIKRAVDYALGNGEDKNNPEIPAAPDPEEKKVQQQEKGIGELLGEIATGTQSTNNTLEAVELGINHSNARLDQLASLILAMMNALQATEANDPTKKDK